MLWFLKWYFWAGLLVISLMALLFLPGKRLVPLSKSEFQAFLLCWLVWPMFLICYWKPNVNQD